MCKEDESLTKDWYNLSRGESMNGKKMSIATKNLLILVLTIVPFFISLGLSLYIGSQVSYFGNAINISGSQRMRTMFIANYSQQLNSSLLTEAEQIEVKRLLTQEINVYEQYMIALKDGDSSLDLRENTYKSTIEIIDANQKAVDQYVYHAKTYLASRDILSLKYIQKESLALKDKIHLLVDEFQEVNDSIIGLKEFFDIVMIVIAFLLTLLGITYTYQIRQYERQSLYDYLTGLKNRHAISEDLRRINVQEYSTFFIDLNSFKPINDTYGHDIGDEVLRQVALTIKDSTSSDYVYRYGGDEFVFFAKNHNPEIDEDTYINDKISHLTEAIKTPITDSHQNIHNVSASIGVVTNKVLIESYEDAISLADDLMYDAKIAGIDYELNDQPNAYRLRQALTSDIESGEIYDNISFDLEKINEEQYTIKGTWRKDNLELELGKVSPTLYRRYATLDTGQFTFENIIKVINEKKCQLVFEVRSEQLFIVTNKKLKELFIENKEVLSNLTIVIKQKSQKLTDYQKAILLVNEYPFKIKVE